MRSNTKKKIGRIALGMIFLLNPNINVVDLLPDFIGCVLIMSGLSSLRDISDSLEDARRNFLRLFWISLSHLPAFVLMMIISSTYVSEKTSILVFAFVYSVVEFVLINNALTSLIDGFVYIGERYNGECCFYETKKNGKKLDVSHLRFFSTVFLLVTKGLTVAPNLVYLYDTSLGYGTVTNPYVTNPVEFIGPITAICFVPALIFGIMWARRMCIYLSGIKKDDAFVCVVDEILSNQSIRNTAVYKYRRISTAVFVLFAAIVLCMDFYVDEFNVIPDAVSAIVLFSAAVFMKKRFSEASGVSVAISAVYVIAESVMLAFAVNFNTNFKFSDIGRVVEADSAYSVYIAVLSVCEILFAVCFASVFLSFMHVLRGGLDMEVRQGSHYVGKDAYLASQKYKTVTAIALAALSGVCHIVQIVSMADTHRVLVDKNAYTETTGVYLPVLEGFWMVSFVVNVVFIVFACVTLLNAREELKNRLYIL